MGENQVLRDLLRSLSSFIGDGAGGLLPKLGWDLDDFHNFLNKSETDSAWESYQQHKQKGTDGPQASAGQKRPQEEDPSGSQPKRARGPNEQNGDRERSDSFSNPLMASLNSAGPSLPQNGVYQTPGRSNDSTLLNDFLRTGSSSTMLMSGSSPTIPSGSYGASSNSGSFISPYLQSGIGVHSDTGTPSMPTAGGPSVPALTRVGPTPPAVPEEDGVDSKKTDAYKLVQCAPIQRITIVAGWLTFPYVVITWTITSATVRTVSLRK